jgi:hypothetical protein
VGDARATLTALLPLLKEKRNNNHLAQARGDYSKASKASTTLPSRLHLRRRPADGKGRATVSQKYERIPPAAPNTYDTINLLKMTNINKSRLHLNAGLNSGARSMLAAASTRLGR